MTPPATAPAVLFFVPADELLALLLVLADEATAVALTFEQEM